MFESKKCGQYHELLNGENFEKWFEKVFPLIGKKAVIFQDNVCYHKPKKDKVLIASYSKGNMQK